MKIFSIFTKIKKTNLSKTDMMKKLQLLFISLLISLVSVAQLEQFLKSQPEIKAVEKIQGNDFFTETWKIMVRQPLEHTDTLKNRAPIQLTGTI
jgi:hypothetical protein